MITRETYFQSVQSYGISNLPQPMQKAHLVIRKGYNAHKNWTIFDKSAQLNTKILKPQLKNLGILIEKSKSPKSKTNERLLVVKPGATEIGPGLDKGKFKASPHQHLPTGFLHYKRRNGKNLKDFSLYSWVEDENGIIYAWIVYLFDSNEGFAYHVFTYTSGSVLKTKDSEKAEKILIQRAGELVLSQRFARRNMRTAAAGLPKGYFWEDIPLKWKQKPGVSKVVSKLIDPQNEIIGRVYLDPENWIYHGGDSKGQTHYKGLIFYLVKKETSKAIGKRIENCGPEPKAKVITRKKTTRKKPANQKAKTTNPYQGKKLLNEATHALRIIRRFRNFQPKQDGPPKDLTVKQVFNFLKALEQAILKQRIRKTQPEAKLIVEIQKKIIGFWNGELHDKPASNMVQIRISDQLRKKLDAVLDGNVVRPSVRFINRYLLMQGTAPEMDRAQRLYDSIKRAWKKGTLQQSDPYNKELKSVQSSLDKYLAKKVKVLQLQPQELHGLQGIMKDCKCEIQSNPQTQPTFDPGIGLSPRELRAMTFQSIPLPQSQLGIFLGKLDPNMLAIALIGDPTAGKSTFSYSLAKVFLDAGMKIKYFSREEGVGPLATNKLNIAGIEDDAAIEIVGVGDLAAIREAAQKFEVVFIDSWSVLDEKPEEYQRLRNDFRNTIFVVIFQKTTTGTIRGGSRIIFDTPACINVYQNGNERLAEMVKSRYGTQSWVYSITRKQIVSK